MKKYKLIKDNKKKNGNSKKITLFTIEIETSVLFGFIGGILASIIGGLVTFYVATYQVDQQKDQEKSLRIVQQLPVLVQMQIELYDMKIGFETAKNIYGVKDGTAPTNSGTIYNSSFQLTKYYDLVEESEVAILMDYKFQADFLELKNEFKTFNNSMAFPLEKNKIDIDRIELKIGKLKQKKHLSDAEAIDLRELEVSSVRKDSEKLLAIGQKEYYMKNIDSYIMETNSLIKKCNDLYIEAEKLSNELNE